MKKVMIKDCIKAVELFNEGTINLEEMQDDILEYDNTHKCILLSDNDTHVITRLYLVNKETMEEVRTVWRLNDRTKDATVTTCINAAIAYNEGKITEDEMLHTLSDYDHCHKNMMLYGTTLGKVMRLYLVDINMITVKTVWRAEWPESYKPLKIFEIIQHIKNLGSVASLSAYTLMYNELVEMLDEYNDTHKSQLNIEIYNLDYGEYRYAHIILYHIRREGDRKRTDKIMKCRVKVG